ncbi:MAG: 50S ribosomal protein L25 [Buchnera aphidicola (Nurudea yanoniella)]
MLNFINFKKMITINAVRREKSGKSSSRRLRLKNKFPAIMYCIAKPNICIELENNLISKIILDNKIYENQLLLIIDEIKYIVKVKSIQRHVFKLSIMHMDFFCIK